jgi:hypothetical protein
MSQSTQCSFLFEICGLLGNCHGHTTPCNYPEDQRFHKQRDWSLKSMIFRCLCRTLKTFFWQNTQRQTDRQTCGMTSIYVFICSFRCKEHTKAKNNLSKQSFYKHKVSKFSGSMTRCAWLQSYFITAALLWHNLGRRILKGFRVIWTLRCVEMGGEVVEIPCAVSRLQKLAALQSQLDRLLSTSKKHPSRIYRSLCSTYSLTGV